ncbi:MAG: tol-pal system YbgF family protein [Phycisphaerae bacterium]
MNTTVIGEIEPPGRYVDVWSRTSRRYRVRAVMMLLLLSILFAGLCCFTFWLRSGTYLPWEYAGYADLMKRSFSPTGSDQITLSDFLSSPISVREVPVHAMIMGLQFASLSSIPMLVAILYRLPFSVLFAAMVCFLAAMPWLGITVMLSCILATLGPFRFTFRYASALIGLIPIAFYFIMASWEPKGAASRMEHHRALLYAPWVLALLGSCVICAVALAIARLINYRPGGIPPVLAMLFAIPVFLFHTQVGRDELEYRILEHDIGPGSASVFSSVHIGRMAVRAARRRFNESSDRSFDAIYKRYLRAQKSAILLQAERDRARAIRRCDTFIERFRDSSHVSSVLFLKARAQDIRVDQAKLKREHRAEFRSDWPSEASFRTWQLLIDRFPQAPITATALRNMAILQAARGDFSGAIQALDTVIEQFDILKSTTQPGPSDGSGTSPVFQSVAAPSGLGQSSELIVRDARRLHEMIMACRGDRPKPISALFGPRADGSDVLVSPLQVLMWLDDASPSYTANLRAILRAFPISRTAGYVDIRLTRLEPAISRRIQRLDIAARTLAGHPSGAEARYYLADALQEDQLLEEAKVSFEELIKAYPRSCWSQEAKQRLTSLAILQEAVKSIHVSASASVTGD